MANGAAGNVGLRGEGGLLVTPTGLAPAVLEVDDVVALDAAGAVRAGERRSPTSEWRLHAAVLAARPDVGAVVHTHSPEATAVACLRRSLPAVHYVVARTGKPAVPWLRPRASSRRAASTRAARPAASAAALTTGAGRWRTARPG